MGGILGLVKVGYRIIPFVVVRVTAMIRVEVLAWRGVEWAGGWVWFGQRQLRGVRALGWERVQGRAGIREPEREEIGVHGREGLEGGVIALGWRV